MKGNTAVVASVNVPVMNNTPLKDLMQAGLKQATTGLFAFIYLYFFCFVNCRKKPTISCSKKKKKKAFQLFPVQLKPR